MVPFWNVLRAYRIASRARRAVRGPLFPGWDETTEAFAEMIRDGSRRTTLLPVEAQRRVTEALIGQLPRSRELEATHFDQVIANGVPAERGQSPSANDGTALLFLHGGGYGLGSPRMYRDLIARVSHAAGAVSLAPDYRLAPRDPFPAQLEDAVRAYRFLLDSGIDPRRILIVGDSAGGGLTLSTLVYLRDAGLPLPAGGVCLSPWTDLEMTGASLRRNARYDYIDARVLSNYARRFVLPAERRHPLCAPLHADLAGLPPLLIQAGSAEVLLDDARRTAERAEAAGVDVTLEIHEGMIHVWHLYAAALGDAARAVASIGEFARRTLAGVNEVGVENRSEARAKEEIAC